VIAFLISGFSIVRFDWRLRDYRFSAAIDILGGRVECRGESADRQSQVKSPINQSLNQK
jgi:hypothetical protein